MKKRLLSTISLLILAIATLLSPIYAQVEIEDPFKNDQKPVIEDVEGLRAEFKQYTQDPESKEVKFELILKSSIDSDRVKIIWTVKGRSVFTDKKQAERNISVQKGKTYTVPISVIPAGYGVSELSVKVEAFKADSSFLVSVIKNFASNDYSEILPITSEYSQSKTLSIIKNVILILLGIGVFSVITFFGFKKFTKWLNKP